MAPSPSQSDTIEHPTYHHSSERLDYTALTDRLRKTLYYGSSVSNPSQSLYSSYPLTDVMVEKFSKKDSNLFLEKLCFDYAAELSREACLSPCSLVVALIYLERLCLNNPNFVSSIPSSQLFLISVMVASKFLNDEGEEDEVINSDWANSAKMDLADLNKLERQFLQAIDWLLFVDDQEFADALARIEFRVAQRECLKRGWLTYTDLNVLARQKLLTDTWHLVYDLVINVSIACVTAYLASLVTLVGSAIVVSSLPWNSHRDPLSCRSSSSQLINCNNETPNTIMNSNSSSSLLPEFDLVLDLEDDDSGISTIHLHNYNLDSQEYSKDFIAVVSHRLPKPPFLKANDTPLVRMTLDFPDPIAYLHQSYCTLFDSISRYRGHFYYQLNQCANLV